MNAIEAENVRKSFKIYFDKSPTLKEKIIFRNRNRHEVHHVLKGISLRIAQGEVVGLIGENGSGKSTLLKLFTKIIYPDEGTIEIHGKVSSLLELGAGFHPDMTGRENIYMNASIFGLGRKEIDRRSREIIDFSELGEYIDNPVRTYSSGMYMRLAFSVAINVDADVLLIDEILAVGDANFQAKCFSKLRELKAAGKTIVIVSHSLGQIEQLCDRSVWLRDGVIRMDGKPRDVQIEYLEFMGRKRSEAEEARVTKEQAEDGKESGEVEPAAQQEKGESPGLQAEEDEKKDPGLRWGSGDARILSVRLLDAGGQEKSNFRVGEPMTVEISYRAKPNLEKPAVGIGIFRNDGLQCYGTNTRIDGLGDLRLGGTGTVACSLKENCLIEGEYLLDVAIHTEDGFAYDYYRQAKTFTTYSTVNDVGVVHLDHTWTIK